MDDRALNDLRSLAAQDAQLAAAAARLRELDSEASEVRAAAEFDDVLAGVDLPDVARLADGDPGALPLPYRVPGRAEVLADLAAVDVEDGARLGGPACPFAEHIAVVAPRHEADLLAVLLVGRGKTQGAGTVADLRLGHVAERELNVGQLRLPQAVQEVALVLV